MRRLILLVPLVLVGVYALAARSEHGHDHEVALSAAPEARVSGIDRAAREIEIAKAMALAASAEQAAAVGEHLARTEHADVVARASASVSVTLEGLLATIEQELERSAESGESIELHNLQVSAELLAQVLGELEATIEIRADDSNQVIVGSGDGARVELTISP